MKYGTALPEDFIIPKNTMFWMKKDLEKNPFELLPIRKGEIVMDCGAHVGTFAAAALEQGAARVACYEALPKNAAVLRENMARYGNRVRVIEKALVAGNETHIHLNLSGFSGAHSIIPANNRKKSLVVPAVNFRAELLRLQPTMIKMDIEGAEYSILESLENEDLFSVKSLFIEFHPIEDRQMRLARIHEFIEEEGFQIISTRNRAFIATR